MCMLQERLVGFAARAIYMKKLLQDWKGTCLAADVALFERITDMKDLKGYVMNLDKIKLILKVFL